MPEEFQPVLHDPSSLASAGFLARYRELTASAYRNDLRCFWAWCPQHDVQPLKARRARLELYLPDLQDKGYAGRHGQSASVDRRGPVPQRRHRPARHQQPHPGRHSAEGAVGGTVAHRAAAAGVRRRSDSRPAAQRRCPRARRAAGHARAA